MPVVKCLRYTQGLGARYLYGPRFLSPDPAGLDPTTPFGLNRYAYANDNPVRFTDPDGRNPFNPIDAYYFAKDVGGLIVTEMIAGTAYVIGNDDVLNMALDDMRAGAFDATASTVGFASPVPGAGTEIKSGSAIFHMARDSSKNERHGDLGRSLKKVEKQIEALKFKLANATKR